MTEQPAFLPQWVSAPGDTIADLLAERGGSPAELAVQIGETRDFVDALLTGTVALTMGIALKLEAAFGIPAAFWARRESSYRASLARREVADSVEAREAWIRSLPLRDMVAFGWLRGLPTSVEERARACLRFFDEPDLLSWRGRYGEVAPQVAFRASPSFDSDAAALAAWLRMGEIEAEAAACGLWNPEDFKAAMPAIRALTKCKDPSVFVPELKRLCGTAGVVVAIVRAPTGCRASGATLFVSPEKALLMLSFRYLSDDHFWFTFFHEAGHLLLHGSEGLILEGADGQPGEVEVEANDYAAHVLVPPAFERDMLDLPVNAREVVRFATRIGVSPGIVVGQMQHRGRFTRRQLNDLKRRYVWASD